MSCLHWLCPGTCLLVNHVPFHTSFYLKLPSYTKETMGIIHLLAPWFPLWNQQIVFWLKGCHKFHRIPFLLIILQTLRSQSDVFFISSSGKQWMRTTKQKTRWTTVTKVTSNRVNEKKSFLLQASRTKRSPVTTSQQPEERTSLTKRIKQ